MSRLAMLLSLLTAFMMMACAGSQQEALQTSAAQQTKTGLALNDTLPVDPKIVTGTLENGITYYIRKNSKPENRAELRLALNAGSMQEDDDQQGLAHFCEHMAFNGTKNFEKQELVGFLESIGMRFGPEINAYTSFDETVYKLQVRTDSLEILKKGFLVLEDWAHNVSYDSTEIEKERGVVVEEWRLGRGAGMRMFHEQLPILLKGSRYAERLPIGRKAVLDTFNVDAPRRFYHDWYRPGLMAVSVAGDFDVNFIEELIKEHFSKIPTRENPRERELYPVPEYNETLFAIASDPEATSSTVSIYHKMPAVEEETVGAYRGRIVERLYSGMFNARLSEIAKEENPPFLFANSGKGYLVRTAESYTLSAMARDNEIPRSMEALLTEVKRVQEHGFTQSELDRQKASILRSIEKAYKERDKNDSRRYAEEYIRNFLRGEPIPGIEIEFDLYKNFVPQISLDEVNRLSQEWISDRNRVVVVSSPEKADVHVPTETELRQVLNQIDTMKVEPYNDDVPDIPLLEEKPQPEPIVEENTIEDLGVTEWTLKNGVKVILKPTDFKNDEVRFSASSPGGYSLADEEDLVPAKTAASVIGQSGFGSFNPTQLQKLLAGKIVRVSPYIGELTEGMRGMASPKDLETMFQLIYLEFAAPRADSSAYLSLKSRMEAYYKNKGMSPEEVYGDSVTVTFNGANPRYEPFSLEDVEEMDLQKSLKFYQNRFADASDFMFLFVGNFDIDEMRPLVETYLGGLPTTDRDESWRDVTYDYPKGVIDKSVKRGIEPKV